MKIVTILFEKNKKRDLEVIRRGNDGGLALGPPASEFLDLLSGNLVNAAGEVGGGVSFAGSEELLVNVLSKRSPLVEALSVLKLGRISSTDKISLGNRGRQLEPNMIVSFDNNNNHNNNKDAHVLELGERLLEELGDALGRLDEEPDKAGIRVGKVERLDRV